MLEEYSVHERVDKDVFQGCRQLKVSPPEGEVLINSIYQKAVVIIYEFVVEATFGSSK